MSSSSSTSRFQTPYSLRTAPPCSRIRSTTRFNRRDSATSAEGARFSARFGPTVLAQFPSEIHDALLTRTDDLLRARLTNDTGTWLADYARLRFIATRTD